MKMILNPFVDTHVNVHEPLLQSTTIYTRRCRRCNCVFVPRDFSGTNAKSFRCNKCLSTKAFVEDLFYSCTIS